jgi:hypothetical protein
MRSLLLGMGIIAAAITVNVQPADAASRPYCVSGNRANGGMPDCSYSTWAQCIAATSGSDTCMVNPWYTGSRQPQGRPQYAPRRQSQSY